MALSKANTATSMLKTLINGDGDIHKQLALFLNIWASDESQSLLCQIFTMTNEIISEVVVDAKIGKKFMIDFLMPLVEGSQSFVTELATLNGHAPDCKIYDFAKRLIAQAKSSLPLVIENFFNYVMAINYVNKKHEACRQMSDFLYKLSATEFNIFRGVMSQLERKLKSFNKTEQLTTITLGWKMLTVNTDQWPEIRDSLFNELLKKFDDTVTAIRINSVNTSIKCMVKQAHLRNGIIQGFHKCQQDSKAKVRCAVVEAITIAALDHLNVIVSDLRILLHVLSKCTADDNPIIRTESLKTLAYIYIQGTYNTVDNVRLHEMQRSLNWIPKNVMYAYNTPTLEERIVLERVVANYLVPHELSALPRMTNLYKTWVTLDGHGTHSFIKLHKNKINARKAVHDWIQLRYRTVILTPNQQHKLRRNQLLLCKLLPTSLRMDEFLARFQNNMDKNPQLLNTLEAIVQPNISCADYTNLSSSFLAAAKRHDNSDVPYDMAVEVLLGRIGYELIDEESIPVLCGLIDECLKGHGDLFKELLLLTQPNVCIGEKGLQLLFELSCVHPEPFFTENTLTRLVSMLPVHNKSISICILKILTRLGVHEPLINNYSHIMGDLADMCKRLALGGTMKQAKFAIHCLFINAQQHPIFGEIIDSLYDTVGSNSRQKCTRFITLSYVAFHMPTAFQDKIKDIILKHVIKDVLIKNVSMLRPHTNLLINEWCDKEKLPPETLCRLVGMKVVTRWLIGMPFNHLIAQVILYIFETFIQCNNSFLEQSNFFPAEQSWLRLTVGCALLKLFRYHDIFSQSTTSQFYELSQLMRDPVPQVREIFARKLHDGLHDGFPHQCLPLQFMAYYALAGSESNEQLADEIRMFLIIDINTRRQFVNTHIHMAPEAFDDIYMLTSPDFLLTHIICILTNDVFTVPRYQDELVYMEQCLRFILSPLLANPNMHTLDIHRHYISALRRFLVTDQASSLSFMLPQLLSVINISETIIESQFNGIFE